MLKLDELFIFKNIKAGAVPAPSELLVFNKSAQTGYATEEGKIYIYGDIFPNKSSIWLTDNISVDAVLAHEYCHYLNRGTTWPVGSRRDEFRASWQASSCDLDISLIDKKYLRLDAVCRLLGVDVPIALFMKGIGECNE